MENEKKYLVSVGSFASERSAIDRAELCKRSGIMAEVKDLGNNDMGNLTAAVLLIAEKLKSIDERLQSFEGVAAREKNVDQAGKGELWKFLVQKRLERKISIPQLAQMTGLTRTYLYSLEKPTTTIKKITPALRVIAMELGFNAEEYEQFI